MGSDGIPPITVFALNLANQTALHSVTILLTENLPGVGAPTFKPGNQMVKYTFNAPILLDATSGNTSFTDSNGNFVSDDVSLLNLELSTILHPDKNSSNVS